MSRFGDQPSLPNAKQTIVKADTNIDVSSTNGQGGTVIVWSDEMTEFDGKINAKGAEITEKKVLQEFASSFNGNLSTNITKHNTVETDADNDVLKKNISESHKK